MKQEEVIYIEGVNKREIKSIVKRFCSEESGKGVRFTVYLHRLEGKAYALNFPQAIPFDLFCELLFKLDTLPNDKRKVRAYCKRKQKGSGLPAESMIYVNDSSKSDFAAVDTKGNVYEDDINTEPYSFKSTGNRLSISLSWIQSFQVQATYMLFGQRKKSLACGNVSAIKCRDLWKIGVRAPQGVCL